MNTPSPNFVSTDLGRLHVQHTGTGPPVVLWHSLFVDSQSWGRIVDELARTRTVYTIDGPSHGKSEAVRLVTSVSRNAWPQPSRRWTGWASPNPWTG